MSLIREIVVWLATDPKTYKRYAEDRVAMAVARERAEREVKKLTWVARTELRRALHSH